MVLNELVNKEVLLESISAFFTFLYNKTLYFLENFHSQLIISLLILFGFFILGKLIENILLNILKKIELNKKLSKKYKKEILIEELISFTTAYIIYFIGIILAISQLFIIKHIFSIIILILLIVIILSLIFSLKETIENLSAYFIIIRKNEFKIKDNIIFEGEEGEIIKKDLLSMVIKTKDATIIIPYKLLFKNKIIKKR